MELIYTTRNSGFEPGKQYRNPRYFDRVEPATSVVLDGDFPAVHAAYESAGVPVTVIGASKPEATKKPARQTKKAGEPKGDENISDQG